MAGRHSGMAKTLDVEQRVARDRTTDSLIGLIALAALYSLTFFFLSLPLAIAMMGIWAAWTVLGFTLREKNPYLLRRLTYFSTGSWVVLILIFTWARIS